MKSSVYFNSEFLDSITSDLVNEYSDCCLDLSSVYEDCLYLGSLLLLSVHSNRHDLFMTAIHSAHECADCYEHIYSDRVDYDSDNIPFVNSGSDI